MLSAMAGGMTSRRSGLSLTERSLLSRPEPAVPAAGATSGDAARLGSSETGPGGNGGRGQYERSIELVRAGWIDLSPMVTHTFALADIAEAFHVASTKAGGAIKVLLNPPVDG